MKIVVARGTIHVTSKPGTADTKPVVKKFGPTSLIDLPDDEANRLIKLGAATKYVSPREVAMNATPEPKSEDKGGDKGGGKGGDK